jgi:hypothetical protein
MGSDDNSHSTEILIIGTLHFFFPVYHLFWLYSIFPLDYFDDNFFVWEGDRAA